MFQCILIYKAANRIHAVYCLACFVTNKFVVVRIIHRYTDYSTISIPITTTNNEIISLKGFEIILISHFYKTILNLHKMIPTVHFINDKAGQ